MKGYIWYTTPAINIYSFSLLCHHCFLSQSQQSPGPSQYASDGDFNLLQSMRKDGQTPNYSFTRLFLGTCMSFTHVNKSSSLEDSDIFQTSLPLEYPAGIENPFCPEASGGHRNVNPVPSCSDSSALPCELSEPGEASTLAEVAAVIRKLKCNLHSRR